MAVGAVQAHVGLESLGMVPPSVAPRLLMADSPERVKRRDSLAHEFKNCPPRPAPLTYAPHLQPGNTCSSAAGLSGGQMASSV